MEISLGTNDAVEIVRASQIEVGNGMLVVQILPEDFIRGGSGSVRFSLLNNGQAGIEIVTAGNTANQPSDEIFWYLVDQDENVLTAVPFKQALGDDVLTLPNGNSVARIAAGKTFVSAPMAIPVPSTAPDRFKVRLEIAHIYHGRGQPEQVKMNGLATSKEIHLIDTNYYGEVLNVLPDSSVGDRDIVIVGRAVERGNGQPMAGVPLNLVITLDGFERSREVYTDEDGYFSHMFVPLAQEAGFYQVRTVHPDITEKPVQATFTINRVYLG